MNKNSTSGDFYWKSIRSRQKANVVNLKIAFGKRFAALDAFFVVSTIVVAVMLRL